MTLRLAAAAALAATLLAPSTRAGMILDTLAFSKQQGSTDKCKATASGGVTTLSLVNASNAAITSTQVSVSLFDSATPGTPFSAWLTLVGVHTVGPAVSVGDVFSEALEGKIIISSASGGAGTNYLTAEWDSLAGSISGKTGQAQIGLGASDGGPGSGIVSYTSDLIPASHLMPERSFSLSFSGVSPTVGLVNQGTIANPLWTVRSFTASNFSGNFTAHAVPEPSALVMAAMAGAAGVGAFLKEARRRVA
jgi:hypothetical protein